MLEAVPATAGPGWYDYLSFYVVIFPSSFFLGTVKRGQAHWLASRATLTERSELLGDDHVFLPGGCRDDT